MKRFIYIILLAIGLSTALGTYSLRAQTNAAITVEADSVVQLGNKFHLSYTYQYADSTDKIATHKFEREKNYDGLKVISGPYTSTHITSKITNGKIETKHKKIYTFVLSLDKEGRYQMPTLRIETTSGKEIVSTPFTIRATKEYVHKKENTSAHDQSLRGNSNTSKANRSKILTVEGTYNLRAQTNAAITVKADSVVQLGNKFHYLRYTYQYADSTDKIATHKFEWEKNYDGLKVLAGPYTSTHITSKTTNRKTETEHEIEYTFILSIDKEGRYKMPTLRIETTSGKEIVSTPFTIRATKEYVHKKENRSALDQSLRGNSNTSKANRSKILTVETTVSKNNITLGDSIECEVTLYTDKSVTNLSLSSISISNAYWRAHELSSVMGFKKTTYKGNNVNSVLLQKFTITPLQAGEIVLEPLEYTVSINEGDPFDIFLNNTKYESRDTVIRSKRIRIKVRDKEIPAEPFVLNDKSSIHNTGVVVDCSSSLLARSDIHSPTFSEIQNQFLKKLLNNEKAEEYSFTLFAGKPHYPKTANTESILKLKPSKENDGSAIYNAILAAALRDGVLTPEPVDSNEQHSIFYDKYIQWKDSILQNKTRFPYSILLLTDGSDNSSYLSEKTLTNILLQHNIRVDVVAFACKKESLYYPYNDSVIKINNMQDFSDVERIAKNTNGEFILVEKREQIPDAIRRIREKIAKREPSKQQPEDSFKPNEAMLHKLYKKIIREAESNF